MLASTISTFKDWQFARFQKRLLKPGRRSRRTFRAIGRAGYSVLFDRGDHKFILPANDDAFTRNILAGNDLQRSVFQKAIELSKKFGALSDGKIFVDIGANFGTHTIYACLCGHFSQVIAYEPDPKNLEILQLNLALNQLNPIAKIMPFGCSDEARFLPLSRHSDSGGIANFIDLNPNSRKIKSSVYRLDESLRAIDISASEIGMIFIDVEGYEYQVCNGAGEYLEVGTPAVIEFNSKWYSSEITDSFIKLMKKNYDIFFDLSRRKGSKQVNLSKDLNTDILAIRNNRSSSNN